MYAIICIIWFFITTFLGICTLSLTSNTFSGICFILSGVFCMTGFIWTVWNKIKEWWENI